MSTLRTRQLFDNAALTLIAIESVDSRRSGTKTGCQLFASVEPVAVVVCGPGRAYALDMQAKLADLEQLKRDIPGLNTAIAQFSNSRS